MASICETFTAPDQVVTVLATQVINVPVTITGAPITSTTSVLVLATACSTPEAVNGTAFDPVCSTTTSLVPTQVVLPGVVEVTQSPSSTVLSSLSTSQGDVSTSCRAIPTTAPATTAAVTTTARRSRSTTEAPVASSSALAEVLPSSSSLAVVDPATLIPVSEVTGESSPDAGRSTITSFRTVVITMTDANGRQTVLTSASASLNTVSGGRASNHTGAIAGGVAGGIAAIVLAVVVFLLLRRKGLFRREDEQFNDDIWNPPNHSPDEDFDGPSGGAVGSTSLEEKDAGPSGPEMAQRSPSRASWLSGGDRAQSMYLDNYGSQHGSHVGYQHQAIPVSPQGSVTSHGQPMSLGHATSRRLSHRSMHSGSSHSMSYESNLTRQPTLPRLPSNGHCMPHEFFQQIPSHQQHYGRQSYPGPQVQRKLSSGVPISEHSDSGRTAATQGSNEDPSSQSSHHQRSVSSGGASIASRRMSTHMRPSLAVLTALDPSNPRSAASGLNYTSSALDSNGSQVPGLSAHSFGSDSSAPSSALPTPQNMPSHTNHGIFGKALQGSDELFLKPIPRPGMERTYSSDSCMAPSQFLGARVVNADDTVSVSAASDAQEVMA